MEPLFWQPPVELSMQEEHIVKRIRKAKLFVLLRKLRHELLDEAFQQELAHLYRANKRGQPPIALAQLALAMILQAYIGVSDDEVIEATLMDRRWQLVLDCLDTEHASFSKGALRVKWIDGWSNERSRLLTKARRLAHEPYVLPQIAVLCGEQDEWKIHVISLGMCSKKSCASWPISRGEN